MTNTSRGRTFTCIIINTVTGKRIGECSADDLHDCLESFLPDTLVLPLLKKAGLDSSEPAKEPANYRPISNLPTVSKVLERLMLATWHAYVPACSALPTAANSSLHTGRDISRRLHYWKSWTMPSRRPMTRKSLS